MIDPVLKEEEEKEGVAADYHHSLPHHREDRRTKDNSPARGMDGHTEHLHHSMGRVDKDE